MTQWMVAPLNPPHLKAMSPWEGCNDIYREWAFHGGIPETFFYRFWYRAQKKKWAEHDIEDLPANQEAHPLFDEYWADKQADLEKIEVPMYVGTSWSTQGLHTRGCLEGFRQSASEYKWLEVHGRKEWEYYYDRERLERQKRFFDYFLKGIENDWLDTPRVRLEIRERFFEGMFRLENEWPLARTQYEKWYLDGEKELLSTSRVQDDIQIIYSVGQDAGEQDSVRFRITFDQDTEITGYMKLKLWVSADGSDDMDLFVGIKKFDRRGKEVYMADFNHHEQGQVATGWLRVSHRERDVEKSTPFQPWLKHERLLKLKEGEIVPAEIEIMPSSTLFRVGEGLELVIQGSEIITTGHRYQHKETVNKGRHIIHAGGKHDSHLLVPLIP